MTDIQRAIETWKKAYRLLDVPETASALAIKSNYRKLIKRWHPDRPATGAATVPESVTMTKLINQAYAQIQNAPLRYYEGGEAAANDRTHRRRGESRGAESLSDDEAALIEKRAEYAVRIICGVLSGAFVGLLVAEDMLRNNVESYTAALVCALLFGLGAVKVGDKFWRQIFWIWLKWQ